MPDRIDPLGGWFVTNDEPRVVNPQGFEAAQLQPRVGALQTIWLPCPMFVPDSDINTWKTTGGAGTVIYTSPSCAPCATTMRMLLGQFPTGAKFVELGMRTWRKDNLGGLGLDISLSLEYITDADGTSVYDTVASTANGAWTTDVKNLASLIVNPAYLYMARLAITVTGGGYVATDGRFQYAYLKVAYPSVVNR